MQKFKDFLPHLAGISQVAPLVPWNTIYRESEGQGPRGLGAGLLTDAGRAGGSLLGGLAARRFAPASASAATRLAILLGSSLTGGTAGHALGRLGGEHFFHPDSETILQKLRHLVP